MMADQRITQPYIATQLGTSQEGVHAIIHNDLLITKVSARWVPKLASLDLKRARRNMSMENLAMFERGLEKFLK